MIASQQIIHWFEYIGFAAIVVLGLALYGVSVSSVLRRLRPEIKATAAEVPHRSSVSTLRKAA